MSPPLWVRHWLYLYIRSMQFETPRTRSLIHAQTRRAPYEKLFAKNSQSTHFENNTMPSCSCRTREIDMSFSPVSKTISRKRTLKLTIIRTSWWYLVDASSQILSELEMPLPAYITRGNAFDAAQHSGPQTTANVGPTGSLTSTVANPITIDFCSIYSDIAIKLWLKCQCYYNDVLHAYLFIVLGILMPASGVARGWKRRTASDGKSGGGGKNGGEV